MSEIAKYLKNRKPKIVSTTHVPATFTPPEEVKVDALYDERNRLLDRRMLEYAQTGMSFVRSEDQIPEKSIVDESLRNLGPSTNAYNALGDRYAITSGNKRAFDELCTILMEEQRLWGERDPLVQQLKTMLNMCRHNLWPRSFTTAHIDVDRMTTKQGFEGFFSDSAGRGSTGVGDFALPRNAVIQSELSKLQSGDKTPVPGKIKRKAR